MVLCTRVASLTHGVSISCNRSKTVISDFRREVAENCTLLVYYSASSVNSLPTFWDNLLFPYSGSKNPKKEKVDSLTLRLGSISCPITSVRNYYYSLRNDPEERSPQK